MNYCMSCMQTIIESDAECPFCGLPTKVEYLPHHLIPGTVLNKRYMVGKVIGQGGFGITYIGRDMTLNIKVAIKEYYPNGYVGRSNTVSLGVNCNTSGNDQAFYEKGRERFLKEAQILAKFSDEPGIVSVRDFFEENNTVYIVMEYLEGEDLKEYLKENGTISAEKTVQMMMPVIKSLERIHTHGLIHRDISPDNIRLSGNGVKLLDFGAARTVSAVSQKSLSVMLKPGYAPYEQYFSTGEQGYWTDVYALCATMYKCITGITPEEAPARMASDQLKMPSALGISISPVIEEALMKGLSVSAKDRYQSMTELMRGLDGVEEGTGYEGVTVIKPVAEQSDSSELQEAKPVKEDEITVPPRGLVNNPVSGENEPVKKEENKLEREENHGRNLKEADRKKNGMVIGFVLVIVLLLGVLAVLVALLLKGNSEDTGKNIATSTPVPTATIVPVDNTATPEPTTPKPAATSEPTPTPKPAATSEPTPTPKPAATSEPTPTPEPAATSEPTSTPEPTAIPEPTTSPESAMESEPTEGSAVEMSDNLFDYTFELDGVLYKLPMTYQDFVNIGWELYRGEDEEEKLNGYSYYNVRFVKKNKTMYVDVVNMSGHARAIKDCIIGGMTISSNKTDSFTMAKNISFDSTIEEIKEAFGIPDTDYTSSITYDEGSNYKKVKFSFYNGNFSDVIFQCFEAIGEDVTVVSEERPDYLEDYLAPTEIGTDMTDTLFELDGVIYRLPCPLSEFLSNGWKIASKNISSLGAGNSDINAIKIEKDGVKLEVGLKNFSEKEVYIDNCAVYQISFASYDFKNVEKDFGKLPNGITLLSSEDEISTVCKDFERSEGTYSITYTYYDYYYTKEVNIWLSKDSSDSSITVKNTEWDY